MLTDRQKDLLRYIVKVREEGDFVPFQFLRGDQGKILAYKGRPVIPIDADDDDFEELEEQRLVNLNRNEFGILTGKPTERGVRFVRSNFAIEPGPTGETSSPRLSGEAKRKRTLLKTQIEEIEGLIGLPLDHPEVEEWERKTIAVLGAFFGPKRWDGEFGSLRQMEEISTSYTYTQDWESSEVRGKRLREKQRALLRTALFELENLTPLAAEPAAPSGDQQGKHAPTKLRKGAFLNPAKSRELLRKLLDETDEIDDLPLDSPDVEEWEQRTASVLKAAFGEDDARVARFLSPGSARPYTQSEVFDFRRATLREALFSLEHLSPRLFEPEGYGPHPKIEEVRGKVFRDGHFREAAFNAYVVVIEEVKTKTGLLDKKGKPMDAEPLMRQAFDCENNKTPPVRFNDLKTRSERDEQQGFMHLFLGLVRLRHSKAHSIRPFDDPSRAHEYLCLASLLMRLLDNATIELRADAPEEQTS